MDILYVARLHQDTTLPHLYSCGWLHQGGLQPRPHHMEVLQHGKAWKTAVFPKTMLVKRLGWRELAVG